MATLYRIAWLRLDPAERCKHLSRRPAPRHLGERTKFDRRYVVVFLNHKCTGRFTDFLVLTIRAHVMGTQVGSIHVVASGQVPASE